LLYLCPLQDSSILKEATVSLSSISAGSLLDSPLASTLTASTNQAVSTGTRSVAASALNGSTSHASLDLLTQDLISLLKALAYGDIAGAKTDLAKYKADLKAQTTAPGAGNGANGVASINEGLTSASIAGTVNQSDSLVASISASLKSGSVQGALQDLTGYLVQNGQVSGGLINTLA
jgi:hypothetical protein